MIRLMYEANVPLIFCCQLSVFDKFGAYWRTITETVII